MEKGKHTDRVVFDSVRQQVGRSLHNHFPRTADATGAARFRKVGKLPGGPEHEGHLSLYSENRTFLQKISVCRCQMPRGLPGPDDAHGSARLGCRRPGGCHFEHSLVLDHIARVVLTKTLLDQFAMVVL
jgi:hypothetical protein